jgi:Caspase domain
VGYDQSGRIKLKGTYQNEDQIDLAFMVAITVVGVNSLDISPVTPRDLQEIKMVSSNSYESQSNEASNKYALLVGVSKFKQQFNPIITAVRDVESIKQILKKNGFKEENIRLLTDEQATKSGILNAMREFEDKVTANDVIVVYISTHGTLPDTFGKMGIIPYDLAMPFSLKNTEDMQSFAGKIAKDESGDAEIIKIAKDRIQALKTAVSFDNLLDFFTGIKTDRFVAILDTCYSGAALNALTYPVGGSQYAEREKVYSQSQNTENKAKLLGKGDVCNASAYKNEALIGINRSGTETQCQENGGNKGLVVTDVPKLSVSSNISGDYEYKSLEKYRTGFSPIENQQGKTIITATNEHEKSWFPIKNPHITNSYFTYYLVKGLNESKGQIFPAFDYARIRTEKVVSDKECKQQTPEMVSTPGACVNLDLSQ